MNIRLLIFCLLLFFFVYSCQDEENLEKPDRVTYINILKDDSDAFMYKISKEYCFFNGLCTGVIDLNIFPKDKPIDSIIFLDWKYIDSLEVIDVEKLDLKKASNYEIVEKFFFAASISKKFRKKNGVDSFRLPIDWFFENINLAEKSIESDFNHSGENKTIIKLNNLSHLKSLVAINFNKVEVNNDKIHLGNLDSDFSIVMDTTFYNIARHKYFFSERKTPIPGVLLKVPSNDSSEE